MEGPGEVACVRVLTAFAEEPGSVPSSCVYRTPSTLLWLLPMHVLQPLHQTHTFFFKFEARWRGKGIILKVYLLFADKLKVSFGLSQIFMLKCPEPGLKPS